MLYVNNSRWNDTKDPQCMTAEQAHEELKTKAHQQYKDIAVVNTDQICLI